MTTCTRIRTARRTAASLLLLAVAPLAAQTLVPLDPEYPYAPGRATITPAGPMIAGSYGTWTVTYTAGEGGVPTGGGLQFALYRAGFSTFQMDRPNEAGYTTLWLPLIADCLRSDT